MNEYIDGKVVQLVRFKKSDIVELFGNVTEKHLQYIANVLAANVEVPEINEDGFVEITESNFNDCFNDMLSEIEILLKLI